MIIYEYYDTDDLIMNKPCFLDGVGNIYPVILNDYKKFSKYINYIKFNKELIGVKSDDISLLKLMFFSYVKSYTDNVFNGDQSEAIEKVSSDLIDLFKIVLKKNFELKICDEDIYFLSTEKDDMSEINEDNYDIIRGIILKQNVIHEEKIYEDEVANKWLKKAKKAHSKNQIDLAEIIALVKNNNGLTYSEILEQNMFQLYLDFKSISIGKEYEASILFKTVSDKVQNVDYSKLNIEELFNEKEHLMTADSLYNKLG